MQSIRLHRRLAAHHRAFYAGAGEKADRGGTVCAVGPPQSGESYIASLVDSLLAGCDCAPAANGANRGGGAVNDDEMEQSKPFLRAYARLIEAAGLRGLVTYGDIASIMGLPPKGSHMGVMVGRMAGLISRRERACGRPMLSSVLVSSTNHEPGPGFYQLAMEYGLLAADASKAEQYAFWEAERDRVYREWQS